MSVIQIADLAFGYGNERNVIEQITLTINKGESVGLIGANGVGKSTLLRLLVGLQSGYQGELKIHSLSMEKKNLRKIREHVGYVFQDADSQLFSATVGDDVAFGPRNYGYNKEEVERRVKKALQQVHIEHLREKRVYQLSGGEKKMASIATVLSMEPDIFIMDEPTNALDPRNRRNLITTLNGFSHLKILASHDLDFIMDTCERTILLYEGKIIRDGKTQEILRDKELLEQHGLELPLRFYYQR